jgi:hypothetical protein
MANLHFETIIVYFTTKWFSHPFHQGGAVKSSIIRALLTLTATGAIVAGYGTMPTASATPAQGTSSWPLGLYVTCGPNYEVTQDCVAEAYGGSGTGYTFTWETGKVKAGGTSEATVNCPENSGYRYETVSVTDSNNGYADTQVQVWCSPW